MPLIVFVVDLVLAHAIDPAAPVSAPQENSLEVVWALIIVVQFVILGYYVSNVIGGRQKMPEAEVLEDKEDKEDEDNMYNRKYRF